MSIHVLVTGGAGYIGSHMVKMLVKKGYQPVILDNLITGHKKTILDAKFIHADLNNKIILRQIFQQYRFQAVFHFASFIQVEESHFNPQKYYQNNLVNTLNLLEIMLENQVKYLIFSSSAAVYGEPQYTPIDIYHPKKPMSAYGKSKWMIEKILQDYDLAYGLRYAALRYFNAAGADPDGELGECHEPETHLIPLIMQAASGRRENIKIYGNDYETPDGSCIRDYIHVTDLCQAHYLAFEFLKTKDRSAIYNLGNGKGFSVQEVIHVAKKITNKNIPIIISPRRLGDPAVLIADSTLAKAELAWQPQYNSLDTIIEHAWNWEMSQLGEVS